MYRTYDYTCEDCGHTSIELFKKDQEPDATECTVCEGVAHKHTVVAPLVMRAGFADGQKRGERWHLAKESAKIEHEAARLRKKGQRAEAIELRKEAKKVAQRASTKRDKTDK